MPGIVLIARYQVYKKRLNKTPAQSHLLLNTRDNPKNNYPGTTLTKKMLLEYIKWKDHLILSAEIRKHLKDLIPEPGLNGEIGTWGREDPEVNQADWEMDTVVKVNYPHPKKKKLERWEVGAGKGRGSVQILKGFVCQARPVSQNFILSLG